MRFSVKQWLNRTIVSVGWKINSAFVVILILFFVFSVYTNRVFNDFSVMYSRQVQVNESILLLKESFFESSLSFREYLKTGNRIKLTDFNNAVQNAETEINRLESLSTNGESVFLLRSIQLSFQTYFSECSFASFQYSSGNFDYYTRLYYSERIMEYLQVYCDQFMEMILKDSILTGQLMEIQQRTFSWWNFVLSIVFIVVFLAFLGYITRNVTIPLERLVEQARKISSGTFDVRVPVRHGETAVGLLSSTFNNMAQNIRTMMTDIQDKHETERMLFEEQKKNLQFKDLLNQANFLALQAQTNPHFLFNTLNSISRTITLGKTEQSLLMIDALSSLLRYSLLDAGIPVTIGEELEITSAYLKIQKIRFQDRLRVHLELDPALEHTVMVPRFTIQPLVENAIMHGIEPKEGGGTIIIKVSGNLQCAKIRIFDNGTGISKDRLREIMDRPNSAGKRIGVWNTRQRILMWTDNPCSFRIASREGRWTLVTIVLPRGGETHVHHAYC